MLRQGKVDHSVNVYFDTSVYCKIRVPVKHTANDKMPCDLKCIAGHYFLILYSKYGGNAWLSDPHDPHNL